MKIPKGTFKAVFEETNRMYFRNLIVWLKIALLWLGWGGLVYFFYFNNASVINFLNDIFSIWFFVGDFLLMVSFFLALAVSLVATILIFGSLDRGEKILPLFQVYRTAVRLLWPLFVLKVRYVFGVFWRLFLLIFPGVLKFADGFAYYQAFLYDHKQGQEAIRYSEKVVRIDRARYWDYLLMGFLVPAAIAVPFMVLTDQCSYILRLKDLYELNLVTESFKYVALYFAVVYFLVFHYRVYSKFKTYLAAS